MKYRRDTEICYSGGASYCLLYTELFGRSCQGEWVNWACSMHVVYEKCTQTICSKHKGKLKLVVLTICDVIMRLKSAKYCVTLSE
jgi:hypothetical protein